MLEIDGSEGGGQVLRTSLGLSALTGKPFRIKNIRKTRPKPGLAAQHLACVSLMSGLCNAHVEGSELGSTGLVFIPRENKARDISHDIGTAGSITLLLQSAMIPLAFSTKGVTLTIRGGTDVKWSPPADYMQDVIIPNLDFADIGMRILKRGYYPKGGGELELRISPMKNQDTKSDKHYMFKKTQRGRIIQVAGVSHASAELEKATVSERQALSAKNTLSQLGCEIEIKTEYSHTLSTGSGITLYARDEHGSIIGADALGEKGKRAETVGKEAAEKLLEEISPGQPIDSHMADNIIPYLGLLGGEIRVTGISNHTKTNIRTTEAFLGRRFRVEGNSISMDPKDHH